MQNSEQAGRDREQLLNEFREKLKALSDLELITLFALARRGTMQLDAEWDLIVEQLAARRANQTDQTKDKPLN